MDTMAAFALGTEPPLPSIVAGEPYKDMQVLQPQIWRQIIGLSLWNFIVIMCVIFFAPMTHPNMHWAMTDSPKPKDVKTADSTGAGADGSAIKDLDCELSTDPNDNCGSYWKRKHMTYIFNIFVFLQLFN